MGEEDKQEQARLSISVAQGKILWTSQSTEEVRFAKMGVTVMQAELIGTNMAIYTRITYEKDASSPAFLRFAFVDAAGNELPRGMMDIGYYEEENGVYTWTESLPAGDAPDELYIQCTDSQNTDHAETAKIVLHSTER